MPLPLAYNIPRSAHQTIYIVGPYYTLYTFSIFEVVAIRIENKSDGFFPEPLVGRHPIFCPFPGLDEEETGAFETAPHPRTIGDAPTVTVAEHLPDFEFHVGAGFVGGNLCGVPAFRGNVWKNSYVPSPARWTLSDNAPLV